jgi:hypothetical protein
MKAHLVTGILWGLLAAGAGTADEIELANGHRLEGIAREEGGRIVVEVPQGTLVLERSQVRAIQRNGDQDRELESRLRDARTGDDFFAAAQWAEEKGMATRAGQLLEQAIRTDPNHAGARAKLGYEKVGESWLRGDDLMRAKGLVLHEGQWIPRETYAAVRESEARLQIEREKLALEQQKIDLLREFREQVEIESTRRLAQERDETARGVTSPATAGTRTEEGLSRWARPPFWYLLPWMR